MTELVFQAKRLLKIEERFGHPHVERETSLYDSEFHCVKHEAQIIQGRSGDDGDGRNREFYREIHGCGPFAGPKYRKASVCSRGIRAALFRLG